MGLKHPIFTWFWVNYPPKKQWWTNGRPKIS